MGLGIRIGIVDWDWALQLGIWIGDWGLGIRIGDWGLGIGDWDWGLGLGIDIEN